MSDLHDTADMAVLRSEGFHDVGHLFLDEFGRIRCRGFFYPEPGVYAFVADDVSYLGYSQNVERRVSSYTNKNNENRLVHDEISKVLRAPRPPISVWTCMRPTARTLGGLPLCIAYALEQRLIRELQPAWNERGY